MNGQPVPPAGAALPKAEVSAQQAALPPELTSPKAVPTVAPAAAVSPSTNTGLDEGKASVMPADTGASPVKSGFPAANSLHPRQLDAQNKLAQAQSRLDALQRAGKGKSNFAFTLKARIGKLTKQAATPPRATRGGGGAMRFNAEREAAQTDDILDWTVNQGGVLSRSGYQKRFGRERYELNKSLYDDAPQSLAAPHHNKIFGSETPDTIAQSAYRAHLIDEPTPGAYWAAVADASRVRLQHRQNAKREEARYVEDIKAEMEKGGPEAAQQRGPTGEDDVVYSKVDINRELNRLLDKKERTPTENARITTLQNWLGQQDLFAVETRDPAEIERERKAQADKDEIERRRTRRLQGGHIETQDNLFGERQEDKSGNGLFFSKTAQPSTLDPRLSTADVEAHLAEAHGAQPGGVVQVVDEPDAGFDGRAVFDKKTGDLLRIEINAAEVSSPADVDRVFAHEIAHVVWRDGGVQEVLGTLTPGERAEIARDLKELGYEDNLRDEEAGARGLAALADKWRGRSWWERLVARVLAWARGLGLRLHRRAAEFIAARATAKTQADVIAADQFEQLTKLPGAIQARAGGRAAVLVPPGERLAAYKITAHHGTPHQVDKFSTSKVGTGEGAQVYGWGLYFAENEEVAKDYAKKLGTHPELYYDGKPIATTLGDLDSFYIANLRNVLAYKDTAKGMRETIEDMEVRARLRPHEALDIKQAIAKLKGTDLAKVVQKVGKTYTVTLNVEPEELLDWDKPLSEQSERVKKALDKTVDEMWTTQLLDDFESSGTAIGSRLYDAIAEHFTQEAGYGIPLRDQRAASEHLASLGIKGIRYLDQGSRPNEVYYDAGMKKWLVVRSTGGIGKDVVSSHDTRAEAERSGLTYNYVIFNEEDITITHANGQPVSAAEASGQRSAPEVRESRTKRREDSGERIAKDAEYLAAIRSADPAERETAQRLVNEAEALTHVPALTEKERAAALSYQRLELKPKVNAPLVYRGISETTGKRSASEGRGIYTTADIEEAARYGDVVRMPPTTVPTNPLGFADYPEFQNWIAHVAFEVLGYRNIREFNRDFPDPAKLVMQLGYNGAMFGKGRGASFVQYPQPDLVEYDAGGMPMTLLQRFPREDIRESRVKRSSGPVESLKVRRDDAAARGFSYVAQMDKLKSDGKTVPKSLTEAIAKQAAELKEATFQLLRHPDYVADQVRAVDAKLTELNTLRERQRILKAQGQDLESDARARLGELEHWEPETFAEDTVLFQTAEEFIGIPPTLIAEAIERTPGLKHFSTAREKEQVQAILDNPNLTPSQRQQMLDDLEKNRGRALAPLPMPSDLPPRGNVALATSTTLAGNADPTGFWQGFQKWLRNFATPTPEVPVLGPQARWNAPMRGFLNAVRSGTITAQHDAEAMVEKVLQPLLDLPRKQLDPTALDKHKTLARKLQFAEKQFEAQVAAMRAEIDSLAQMQASRAAIRERREALAEFEDNPPAKIADLQKRLTEAEAALAENPMHLFKLAVLYNDYESRFQMLQPKQKGAFKFPGGLTIEDIVNEHARVNAAIEKSSAQAAIKEAMDRHYRMMADLEQRLLDHGLLIPEDMKNGAYFPHQVLDYTSQHLSRLRPTTEERFRGYLIDPTGSKKAIETDYLQAVYRHAAEVLADNAHLDAVEEFIQPLDISQRIKDNVEAAAQASGRTAGKMEWRSPDNLPPGHRFFDATKKLPMRPGYVLDADTIAKALEISLKDGDVVEQMKALGVDFTVTADMLKQALVAGEKQPWVLPNEIADALDGILEREKADDAQNRNLLLRASRKAVSLWKLDTLFAPWHYIRYEWGNTVSDLVDKVAGADPGMARYLPRAFREVVDFVDNDKATPELRAAFEQRVLDTVTFAEVGKVASSPAFSQLRSDTQRALNMAGNLAKDVTFPVLPIVRLLSGAKVRSTIELSRLREASFRYAKFLADLERIKAGKNPVYAGAYWKDVEQERSPEAKAAFISRRTFGDYGDMSVYGTQMRKNLIPFYSWTEVNFRYHTNLLKNFGDMIRKGEFGQAKDSARASAAFFALRLLLPYLAVQLWNAIGGKMAGAWDDDDLEATLSDADRRRFHIILGKDDRGQTRVVYMPSAWGDVVSWFGGDNLARLFGEYSRGEITFERLAGDYAKQFLPIVGNQVVQSAGPFIKGPFIAASGKNPFPDVTNMRTISGKEKWFAVLQTMTDREGTDLLRRIFDNDYYPKPAGEVMQQLILQIRRRDPEQWAFYEVKEKVSAWKYEKTGKRYEAGDYTAPEAEALRNFRRAVYLGDVDAAQRFYGKLLAYGYTAERLKASIQHQAPMAELNEKERPEFIRSLSRAERQQLVRAVEYWERLGALKGKESGLFPKKGVKTFTPQPDRLTRAVETFDRKPDDEVKRTAERMVESALSGRGR